MLCTLHNERNNKKKPSPAQKLSVELGPSLIHVFNYNELQKREDVEGDDAHSGFHHGDGTREGLLLDLTLVY